MRIWLFAPLLTLSLGSSIAHATLGFPEDSDPGSKATTPSDRILTPIYSSKPLRISLPDPSIRKERITYSLDSPLFQSGSSLSVEFERFPDRYLVRSVAMVKTFFKNVMRTMTCNWFLNGDVPDGCMERGKSEKRKWLYFLTPKGLNIKEIEQENVRNERTFEVTPTEGPVVELVTAMYALRGKQSELDKSTFVFKAFLTDGPEDMSTVYMGTRPFKSAIGNVVTPHQVVRLRSALPGSNLNKINLEAWEDSLSGELSKFTFKVLGSDATATLNKIERE